MSAGFKNLVDNFLFFPFSIKAGVSFQTGSHLELQPPEEMEELAVNTKIQFYFNVTKSDNRNDGKAFLFYLGNIEGTHTKMPLTFTDDFIAAEVIEGGRVKLTVDMGAGMSEIFSHSPITYGQWHELTIDRRGYYVSMTIRSEPEIGNIIEDVTVDEALPRKDDYGRPFGAVFNLHKDYSKLFVGGFNLDTRIQEAIKSTDMEGEIEGLTIGGQSLGLWNFRQSKKLKGAPARNKLKEKSEKGLRFDGQGSHFAMDRSNYQEISEEFSFKLSFKADKPNGILLFIGDKDSSDYAMLELRNNYLTYVFNLGNGAVNLEAPNPVELGTWVMVEIRRKGLMGEMFINGENMGSVSSQGPMDELSVGNEVFIGGFMDDILPATGAQTVNFVGCIKDVYFGPDPITLSATSPGAVGVRPGCSQESVHLATFPAASPGYMQLQSLDLKDHIEMSFMFRTSQSRALLLYMHDSPASFYYLSLNLIDGMLNLNVFPDHSIGQSDPEGKPVYYNDTKWHSVSILVTQSVITLHIDDYEHFISNNVEQLPLLNQRYNVYLGGVPDNLAIASGASQTKSPFIGCIRDVLIGKSSKNYVDKFLFKLPFFTLFFRHSNCRFQ